MDLPRRIQLKHTPPAFVPDGAWFFLTLCCHHRRFDQLCRPTVAAALLEDAVAYHRNSRWQIHLFLLMPDHLHAIVAVPVAERLSSVVRDWKRLAARSHGIVWQRGYFDHRLRGGESLELKSRYVRENPVRAGLVEAPEAWPHFIDFRTLSLR